MVQEQVKTEDQIKSGEPITIVLSDDHQVVREGVRSLLEEEPDI